MSTFQYIGQELDVFSYAKNWKQYWFEMIRPFIGDRVLEVGAGIGSNTEIAHQVSFEQWLCLEPDQGLVDGIQRKYDAGLLHEKIELLCGTLSDVNPARKFDTLLYIDVLEHIETDQEELKIAMQHLDLNGRVIIVAPAHNYLYSDFDRAIGHFRRYNRGMIDAIVPYNAKIEKMLYLDSVGFFASLANRIFLKEKSPSKNQINFWDKYLVSSSKIIDPLIRFSAGKTIVAVIKKTIS